ncbi:MAG: glycosyltransferase family 4 protein [Romboutsia sp.]
MKILFIINNINQVGGIDRVLNGLSNYFTEKFNYKVEILSIYTKKSELFYKYNDLVKITHGCKQLTNNKKQLIKDIKSLLLNCDADIIITFHGFISTSVLLNKKILKNKKIIVTEHVDYFDSTKIRRMIRAILYRKADKVIVLTNKSKNLYDRFLNNVQVIQNPISFTSNKELNLENQKIISVGRLEKVKGFDKLIEIFKRLPDKYKDWKLDIIGDGIEREKLEMMINRYNLQDRVKIKHFTKNILDEYLNASIYALTSEYEGLGLVLIEAKECGLPCISFDIDASKEVIENNKDGILAKKGDLDDFVKKLTFLIENLEVRKQYGLNGKKNAEKYNIFKVCEKWKQLFETI